MWPPTPLTGNGGRAAGSRPAKTRHQVRSLHLILAGVSLAIASCDQSPTTDAESSPDSPVIASAAGPAGTSLGDGFSVVDGTELIGDPIPIAVAGSINNEPILDEGWTATSVIDAADPLEVLDAYMRQAEEVGLIEQPGSGCTIDGAVAICSAFARSPDPAQPRSLAATTVRGQRADLLSNHVILRYSTADLYWAHGGRVSTGDGDIELPPLPPWPSLPAAGDPLPTAGEITSLVEVQDGSRPAGPPRLNIDDVTGGVVTILEVTGDPRAVLQSYLDHLASLGSVGSEPDEFEVGDGDVTVAFAGGAGGDGFRLTLFVRPGRPAWLQIEGSHD